MKKAALVFSGGALRGFSQMGAYQAIAEFLKEKNAKVQSVVGTSFGAITASMIALGFSPEEMIGFSKSGGLKLANIRDLKFKGSGLLKPNHLKRELEKHMLGKSFKDTKKNLVINTVDLHSGKEFIFNHKGLIAVDRSEQILDNISIIDAILASTAIPVAFVPRKMYGKYLVDGGLANPIGLDLINRSKFDYVIGVDTCMANFNFVTTKTPTKIQVMQQTISIAQRQFHFERLEKHLECHDNMYIIKPPVGPVNPKKKGEMERVLDCGYHEAQKVLEMI